MNTILRIVLAVATLLTALVVLGFAVWGVIVAQWGLAVTCFMLATGFGYFSYRDYKFFFGDKSGSVK